MALVGVTLDPVWYGGDGGAGALRELQARLLVCLARLVRVRVRLA